MQSLREEAERAVLDWIVGGKRAGEALADVRATVTARGVRCSIVEVAPTARNHDVSPVAPDVLEQVIDRSGMRRVLATSRQLDWRDTFAALASEHGSVGWLAAEPISERDGRVHAMLVVIGPSKEPNDDILLALPSVAKACSPLILQDRAEERSSQRRHTMNNLLAAASANLGYVADLLEETPDQPTTSPPSLADAQEALGNARDALREITVHVAALTSEARSTTR